MDRVKIHGEICDGIKELYKAKNSDYNDSYSKVRSKFVDVVPKAKEVTFLLRINDKLSRLEQLLLKGNQQVKDESINDTIRDLANYCLMELVEREVDKDSDINTYDYVPLTAVEASKVVGDTDLSIKFKDNGSHDFTDADEYH